MTITVGKYGSRNSLELEFQTLSHNHRAESKWCKSLSFHNLPQQYTSFSKSLPPKHRPHTNSSTNLGPHIQMPKNIEAHLSFKPP